MCDLLFASMSRMELGLKYCISRGCRPYLQEAEHSVLTLPDLPFRPYFPLGIWPNIIFLGSNFLLVQKVYYSNSVLRRAALYNSAAFVAAKRDNKRVIRIILEIS